VKEEMSKDLSKKITTTKTLKLKKKERDGITDWTVQKGEINLRKLTECELAIDKWVKCVKEGVKISSDIVPQVGPSWNHNESAEFVVKITNKTGHFILEDIKVHATSIIAEEGKAVIGYVPGYSQPKTIKVESILPGRYANVYIRLSSNAEFAKTDVITARAKVTYKAVPYLSGFTKTQEPIIGTHPN
jgi:hypothetical protein